MNRIVKRPDGFYWKVRGEDREYGPFATLAEAVRSMKLDDRSPEPGETVEEAEAEIGIAEYADPETGEPAEESRPRLEEH
jgi:hypothetical protein